MSNKAITLAERLLEKIFNALSGLLFDVETVEADIDGKEAATTNSLVYGKVSTGVTVPIHVNSDGDQIVVTTPGETIYGEVLPTASCAAGAAIEFDITSFSNLATLKQISITQLTAGTYDYTLEIWEKDGSGYTPGTYADHYLKIFSRDIDVREYSENIDQGLLYRDRDASAELHCRLVNNAAGTTSTFNVAVVAINST